MPSSGARPADRGLADVELARLGLDDTNFFQRQTLGLEDIASPDDDRLAQRADFRVERRLEGDLRPDAARVAGRDRYFYLFFNNEFKRGYTRLALPSKIFCLSEVLKSSLST